MTKTKNPTSPKKRTTPTTTIQTSSGPHPGLEAMIRGRPPVTMTDIRAETQELILQYRGLLAEIVGEAVHTLRAIQAETRQASDALATAAADPPPPPDDAAP